jgi:hypothetical protein
MISMVIPIFDKVFAKTKLVKLLPKIHTFILKFNFNNKN